MSQMLVLLKTGILTWLWLPINCLLLFIDGVVYTCVALSYRLFQLMAQLNFNALSSWMTALVDRVNAIIAVLILFILGYSLVQYLINPDKASDKSKGGGVAIVKNIAIASILLISYNFIFGVLNETTFILVGTPATYKYTYLNDLFGVENEGGDEGLIMRLIVGESDTGEEGTEDYNIDYGRKLALTTLSSFLHGYEEDGLYSREEGYDKSTVGHVYSEALKEKEFNLIGKLITVVAEVGRSVYYFPIISTALGAYIIYTIVTISIELGVRAFKLMVLQLAAPLAIITIMKDGWAAQVWKKYLSVLGKTYADAFIRIASMYFSFAFISVAYNNLDQLFAGAPDADGFTRVLLYGLIIVSALKLGKELPKLIDEIFGSKLADNNKAGLGQFLATAGGLAGGYALGGLAGGAAGFATRFRNSRANGLGGGRSLLNALRGGASGMFTGGFSGAAAGARLRGDKISDFFKTGRNVLSEGWRAGGPGIGGFIMGMQDEYGGSGLAREKQMMDQLENRREYLLKTASTNSKEFNNNGYKYKVDLGKLSADNAVASWRNGDQGEKLRMDIERAKTAGKAIDIGGGVMKTYEDLVRTKSEIETDIRKQFGDNSASILSGDKHYVTLSKQVSRITDTNADEYYGRSSGKAIDNAKIEMLHREYESKRNGIPGPRGGSK